LIHKLDPLTIDGKPYVHSEREYIHSQGGSVTQSALHLWRINGNLAISHAPGDKSELPYIRATPDVFCNKLDETDKFIILATDGLWDFFIQSRRGFNRIFLQEISQLTCNSK